MPCPSREHNQNKGGKKRMTTCLVSSGWGVSERKWVYWHIRNILKSLIGFTQPVFLAPYITCPTTAFIGLQMVHAYAYSALSFETTHLICCRIHSNGRDNTKLQSCEVWSIYRGADDGSSLQGFIACRRPVIVSNPRRLKF